MTDSCLFCRIAVGEIPATIVRRSDRVVVFADLVPQAPFHVLAIPVEHFANLAELVEGDPALASELISEATAAAADADLTKGYRVVFNTGNEGGQSVDHVHAHVLGGRQMMWPPG